MTRARKLIRLGAGLCSLLFLLGIIFPRPLLCLDTGASASDYIIVLGGDVEVRAEHAAELYQQGLAPHMLVSGDGDCELGRAVLTSLEVPRDATQVECGSRNTKENAEFSVRILRASKAKRAIIVTSWFHSRRALACFKKAAPEIQFYSAPAYYRMRPWEWGKHAMGLHVMEEYLKTVIYAVRYQIYPI